VPAGIGDFVIVLDGAPGREVVVEAESTWHPASRTEMNNEHPINIRTVKAFMVAGESRSVEK
jgi:hypothetical protein